MLSDKVLKAILEYLNLEENEEFGIEASKYMRRINKEGIQVYIPSSDGWSSSAYLNELLLGKVKMIKLPFVPKKNEVYYVSDVTSPQLFYKITNYNTQHDEHRITSNFSFRTKVEAIEKSKKILEFLNREAELNETY